jgi:hypothetical protein
LTVYLALALSNRNESQEFHVLLILIILVTTIFFCHALIRLCMMIIHPPSDDDMENQTLPSMIGPGGYANPVVPIRVALARDEEAAGIESEATKLPPPAYGLWRESVVCKHLSHILDPALTRYREWIQTAYSGNVTRRLHSSAGTRPTGLKDVLQLPTDHHLISQKMA